MSTKIAREVRKLRNGMNPQTPLLLDEQVLFSEVCTVKAKGSHVESLVAVTSQRLLIEPWKKRAAHGILAVPYNEIISFYKKPSVSAAGVLTNKYLVVETEKCNIFILTQKRTADQIIAHLQYFTGKKCN